MTTDINETIAQLRELLAKATEGPWWWYQSSFTPLLEEGDELGERKASGSQFNGVGVGEALADPDAPYKVCAFMGDGPNGANNAQFVAEVKNALPALLAHIATLEARVAELNRERVPAQWYADANAQRNASEHQRDEALAALKASEAKLSKHREALEPFKELADALEASGVDLDPEMTICGESEANRTVLHWADFHRAREVYEDTPDDK